MTTRIGATVAASAVPVLKASKPWCVKDWHGVWHACEEDQKPSEGATSVELACGGFLVLPHAIDATEITCPECQQVKAIRLDSRKARG